MWRDIVPFMSRHFHWYCAVMWRAVLTAFGIANGLVLDIQRFGEFEVGYFSLCTQHRDPVMDKFLPRRPTAHCISMSRLRAAIAEHDSRRAIGHKKGWTQHCRAQPQFYYF